MHKIVYIFWFTCFTKSVISYTSSFSRALWSEWSCIRFYFHLLDEMSEIMNVVPSTRFHSASLPAHKVVRSSHCDQCRKIYLYSFHTLPLWCFRCALILGNPPSRTKRTLRCGSSETVRSWHATTTRKVEAVDHLLNITSATKQRSQQDTSTYKWLSQKPVHSRSPFDLSLSNKYFLSKKKTHGENIAGAENKCISVSLTLSYELFRKVKMSSQRDVVGTYDTNFFICVVDHEDGEEHDVLTSAYDDGW